MPRPYIRGLVLLAGLLACGCSLLAKKTPTPAAQIDGKQLAQTPAPPGERFYVFFFGSHDALHRPKYTHSWATLVRATDVPGGEPALEAHTISWLPTSLDIRPLSREVEPGFNMELQDTLKYVIGNKEKVYMWGPYEVWHGAAYRFRVQKDFLDSGAVGYQCDDVIGEAARYGTGCDCIHAITDLDPVYARERYPLSYYGAPATANMVRRFMKSPVFIDPPTTHDWLICRLGLDEYPIQRRQYRGRVVPHQPGAPGLQAAPARPLPIAPIVPKDPTPKTAPGLTPAPKGTPAPKVSPAPAPGGPGVLPELP